MCRNVYACATVEGWQTEYVRFEGVPPRFNRLRTERALYGDSQRHNVMCVCRERPHEKRYTCERDRRFSEGFHVGTQGLLALF